MSQNQLHVTNLSKTRKLEKRFMLQTDTEDVITVPHYQPDKHFTLYLTSSTKQDLLQGQDSSPDSALPIT